MRGSVFRKSFRTLFKEFESNETSPGFARLLGENWYQSHKKIKNQEYVGKNLSNDKSLEVYVAISQKNLSCTIFDKKNGKKQNEPKS